MDKAVVFIGKWLFNPIIIKICQFARCNQYLFYRLMWGFCYVYWMLYPATKGNVLGTLIVAPFTLIVLLALWLKWDSPSEGHLWMIKFWYALLAVSFLIKFDPGFLLIIAGEYARLIDTIPPEQKKEKKVKKESRRAATGTA